MQELPSDIPEECICPISQLIMADPVVCADGHSYERSCIEAWLASGRGTSPKTNMPLPHTNLVPNLNLRSMIESLRQRTPPERKRTFQLKELEDLESFVASLAPDASKEVTAVVKKEESNSKAKAAGVRRQLFSNESAISWSPTPPCPAASRGEEFSSRRSHASFPVDDPCTVAFSETHTAERDKRAEQLKTAFFAMERRRAMQRHEGAFRTGPSGRRVTFPPAENEEYVVQRRALHGRVSRSSSPARNRCIEQNACIQATEHDSGTTPKPGGSAIPLWQGPSTGSIGVYLSAALPPQQHLGDHWSGAGQTQLPQRPTRDTVIAPRDDSRTIGPRDSSRTIARRGSSRTVRQRDSQRSPSTVRPAAEGEHAGDGVPEATSRTGSPVRWQSRVEVDGTPPFPFTEHQRSLSPAQRRPAYIAAERACMWRSDSHRSPSPIPLSTARPETEASRLWVHARESQRSVSPAQQRPATAIGHGITWKMVEPLRCATPTRRKIVEPLRCGTPTRQPVWAEGHVRGAWTSKQPGMAGKWSSPRNMSGNFSRPRLL